MDKFQTIYYYEDKPYTILYEGKVKVDSILEQLGKQNNNEIYLEYVHIDDDKKWMDVVIYKPLWDCHIPICVKEKEDFYNNYKSEINESTTQDDNT